MPGSPDLLAGSWAICLTLNYTVCTTSVSPLGQISMVVEEKPGGLFFIGNSTFKGANALVLDERKEIWKN